MTQEEIIRMAREAGAYRNKSGAMVFIEDAMLERFAALVAAHERNRHAWTQEHWTQYEHAIAAAEREACAKVCEEADLDWRGLESRIDCAAAIRARGE